MGAAAVMSPATAAMGIVIEADAANYNTTEDIQPDGNNERNLSSGDTLATNPADGIIHNNAGTITSNYGTVEVNNGGTVTNNSGGTVTNNNSGGSVTNNSGGTVTNNNSGGSVTNNSGGVVVNNYSQVNNRDGGRVTDNNGTVANQNTETSIVERNNPSGIVSGGTVTDNYGTADHARITGNYGAASDSNVTNNYASGSVTGDSSVADNYGGYIQNPSDTTQQHPAYSGPNPLTPPAPQPSSGSDNDAPEQAPALQPVDNAGGDSSSMGSLTVLPSETSTIQQEEKSFVNSLNSEMAKLGNESVSASATSGPDGQRTINVNMGANNSYTSGMIDALETATDQNVAVAMTVRENGKPMTFTVPANSDYSAVDSYYAQTGSTSEGYRMIQSLVSGSAIEDASGNKIVNTTDTNTLMIRSDAQAVLYWIDHGDTLTTGRGDFYFEGNMLQNYGNQPATGDTANAPLAANVVDGGMIAAKPVKAPAVAITSGGTAKDTTVNNGDTAAIAAVTNGGTATTATVTNGGTAIPAIVNGSTQTIHNPGIYGGTHTVHTGEAVVASGTLPATASSPGTFAVTDNRRVIITNGQGSFADGNGSINIIDLR